MRKNENGECMVEHHTHYKEIHGYDKTVWMTQGEHVKLHCRLRKEGLCNISRDELNTIAMAAHNRTDKEKNRIRKRNKTQIRSYYNNENYIKNHQIIGFYETIGLNAGFYERIVYNHVTGMINYCGWFKGRTGHKIPVINI